MFKVIMAALVAVAFYANATERGFTIWVALTIALVAAVGMYCIYLKLEEMEAAYKERQRRCRRRRKNAQSATDAGTYRRGTSNRHTYARYAQGNMADELNGKVQKAVRDSDTNLPIRKVCGVLSYDYYVSKDKERWI